METKILTVLISIITFSFGSMKQSQADGIMIRFIPSIFTVVQDRYAVTVIFICQVRPLLCVHFISGLYIISSFHAADSPDRRLPFHFLYSKEIPLSVRCLLTASLFHCRSLCGSAPAAFVEADILFEE